MKAHSIKSNNFLVFYKNEWQELYLQPGYTWNDKKIKEYNGTKIILISAYDLDGELVKDLEENKYIAKYIEKPISINSLIESVADTIS